MQLISEEITASPCPSCHKKLDAFTGISGAKPSSGDVTICIYCKQVLQFNDDLTLRHADAEAVSHVTLELSRMQNLIRDIPLTKIR